LGEAKARLARLQREQPFCVYCGGDEPTTSCDHCPPISIFDNRQRPKGLEFGSCEECREGSRAMDLVVGVMSRLFNASDPAPDVEGDVQAHIRGFINNHPDIAALFDISNSPPVLLEGRIVHPISITDPDRISHILDGFAARFGLAMYREHTGGVAPASARIATTWYSNVDLFAGRYPQEFLQAVGNPRTLQMGRMHVAGQFRYWPALADEHTFGVFAAFRESFGIMSIVRTDDEASLPEDAVVLSPGFLKGFKV